METRKSYKTQNTLLVLGSAFIIVSFLMLFIGPELVRSRMQGWSFEDGRSGQIGDAFGGTLGPIIAWVGALLTFAAFWVQYQANELQRSQIKIERFENKFYKLVELHKQNLHEISIGGYDGKSVALRKAFVSMHKELRYCFFVTKKTYLQIIKKGLLTETYSDTQLLLLAYVFFYAGVGIHSDVVNRRMTEGDFEKVLVDSVRRRLTFLHRYHKTIRAKNRVPRLCLEGLTDALLPKSYRPFGGHMSRLGYYYRHLFQTVKFVANQTFLTEEEKEEYLRTLRAQLSDHEQVMLYYNAVVGFGGAWIQNGYFTKYRMIHNLPLPVADFGITPEEKFANDIQRLHDNGIEMFEWQ